MLKISKAVFSIVTIILAGYSIITQNFQYMQYVMLFLGLTMLATGVIEFQKKRKSFYTYMILFASLFIFFVLIQGFLL